MWCGFNIMDYFSPIKENRDFRRIYAKGKSYVNPVLVTYVLKNRSKNVRIGITTSKKTGNAVKRNRSRRVIREAFRMIAPGVQTGYDFIFVARGKTPFVKSTDVCRAMEQQLKGAGVLK
jgi:ribonuclease P protein component